MNHSVDRLFIHHDAFKSEYEYPGTGNTMMVRSNISFTGREWMRSAAHASNLIANQKCDWFGPLLKLDPATICVDSSLFFFFSFFPLLLFLCSLSNYIVSCLAICDNPRGKHIFDYPKDTPNLHILMLILACRNLLTYMPTLCSYHDQQYSLLHAISRQHPSKTHF